MSEAQLKFEYHTNLSTTLSQEISFYCASKSHHLEREGSNPGANLTKRATVSAPQQFTPTHFGVLADQLAATIKCYGLISAYTHNIDGGPGVSRERHTRN